MNKQFGTRIRELRSERNISQKDMAAKLGIPASSFRDLEANSASKYTLNHLPKIADILNVSIAHLIGVEEAASPVDDCRRIRELADNVIQKIKSK